MVSNRALHRAIILPCLFVPSWGIAERMFAVVAMMIGGSVYGYLIGSLTAVVADSDLNNRAFKEQEIPIGE